MFKLIAFDLDDTLFPEYSYIISGFDAVSNKISRDFDIDKSAVLDTLIKLFNLSPKNVFNRYFETIGVKVYNDIIDQYVALFRKHIPNITFYPDVIATLNELRNEYTIAIISDGNKISQRQKITALNADTLFDYIILTDELGEQYWKPCAISFEILSKKYNVDYSEMIYVGDNNCKDFHIKNVYPVTTIGINRPEPRIRKKCIDSVDADFSISTLYQLIDIINKENVKR